MCEIPRPDVSKRQFGLTCERKMAASTDMLFRAWRAPMRGGGLLATLPGQAGKEESAPVASTRIVLYCPDCVRFVGSSIPSHFLRVDGRPDGNYPRRIVASPIATPEVSAEARGSIRYNDAPEVIRF